MGTFPGDWTSLAWGINDFAQVVGESHPPFGSRPVMWNSDAAHTVIALPLLRGDNFGAAEHINNIGDILGFSAYATPGTWDVGPSRAVQWHDGAVFDLQSVLDATGAGWTISSAVATNNIGQIIGYGIHNGVPRAFIMTRLN